MVDEIEACLGTSQQLGYEVTVRVPDAGPAGFVILVGAAGELMLQTKASLTDDMSDVAKRKPSHLLYGDLESLQAAEKALTSARVIVPQRKTFYGATEIWWELERRRHSQPRRALSGARSRARMRNLASIARPCP